MNEIVFVSSNQHKLEEIQKLLGSKIRVKNLNDIGFNEEIEETASTLDGNAFIKANTIWERYKIPCFADDTGLEVEALNGEPGVYSARYAGNDGDSEANINKLLSKLVAHENRSAQFRTSISLIISGEPIYFEGIVKGNILTKSVGSEGFGYDPIFMPDGYNVSFAEMDITLKNKISHRGLAVEKLIAYLNSII